MDPMRILNLAQVLIELAPAAFSTFEAAKRKAAQIGEALAAPDDAVSQAQFDAIHAEHDQKRDAWKAEVARSRAIRPQ